MKELFHFLGQDNTLLVIIGTVIAILTYLHTRHSNRLSHLTPLLDDLKTKGTFDVASRLATVSAWAPITNSRIRNEALEFLLDVERCAKRNNSLEHWQCCLRYDEMNHLKSAVENLGPLIALVRETEIPLEKHVWNGVRRHAFRSTSRLFKK